MADSIQVSESSPASSMPESSGLDHPEFRSHTNRKPAQLAASYPTLYKKGKGVWLIGARSMKGPYTIAKVNDDGSYDLNNEGGTPFKYKVKEKDLRPV